MAALMGEWRRRGSSCSGALVLWLKDMLPGAGLGVIDDRGEPKVAYYYLKRALAPVAVWMTDEGVNGIAVHIANDRSEPVRARLRVGLYRDLEARVAEGTEELELPARSTVQRTVEGLLGRFVDAAWAYRFGPPSQDAIFATLERSEEPSQILSRSALFPAGLPATRQPPARLGLEAEARADAGDGATVRVRTHAVAYGVRVKAPGFRPDDDSFSLEPGGEQLVRLTPASPHAKFVGAMLTALNLEGAVSVPRGQG